TLDQAEPRQGEVVAAPAAQHDSAVGLQADGDAPLGSPAESDRQLAAGAERRVGRAVGVPPDGHEVVLAKEGLAETAGDDLAVGLQHSAAGKVEGGTVAGNAEAGIAKIHEGLAAGPEARV